MMDTAALLGTKIESTPSLLLLILSQVVSQSYAISTTSYKSCFVYQFGHVDSSKQYITHGRLVLFYNTPY